MGFGPDGIDHAHDRFDHGPGTVDLPREPLPFTPEFASAQKERSRRSHKDVTRGEYEDLQAEVERLAKLLSRFAQLAAGTQKRQVEMRADLLAAGAFEKKGRIVLPRDLN